MPEHAKSAAFVAAEARADRPIDCHRMGLGLGIVVAHLPPDRIRMKRATEAGAPGRQQIAVSLQQPQAVLPRHARSTGIYSLSVDVTTGTTTLYASDRKVFLFLVDDLNPIETRRLPDNPPDLHFRGLYYWNSEFGAKTLGMASFYLRAVCQNRNLWGVEGSRGDRDPPFEMHRVAFHHVTAH